MAEVAGLAHILGVVLPRTRTQAGLALVALGALPFCLGATVFSGQVGAGDGHRLWPCPFRAITGVPCPGCGATRAVVLFAHGDARFLDYNPVWVLVLLLTVVCGLVIIGADLRRSSARVVLGRVPWAAVVPLAVGCAWVTALVNAGAITQ